MKKTETDNEIKNADAKALDASETSEISDVENSAAENSDPRPNDAAEAQESASPDTTKVGGAPAPAKKSKLTGAYWYTDKSAEELAKQSFIRTMLTVIAFLLQMVVLVLPQSGIGYITENLPSYAFIYMCTVFVMIFVTIFVSIMYYRRYKLMKRIPKEYAPRGGFKRRSFFGAEAFVVVTAILFIMEISFVCLSYDGFGLLGVFVAALSVAAAVWARMITVLTLKDAIYVPAIGEEIPSVETENTDKTQNDKK